MLPFTIIAAGCLSGCDSGGRVPATRLFFGSNHRGACLSFDTAVRLEAANGSVARISGGDPDCTLSAELQAAGCDASFAVTNDGAVLQVAIENCMIPQVVRLFDCGFTSGDPLALAQNVHTRCECADPARCDGPRCDEIPNLCVSPTDDPGSCEDCDNGLDDNGDGLEDCEDLNCEVFHGCGHWPTTIPCSTMTTVDDTTTTTSTLVTTTLSVTTTTVPIDGNSHSLSFRLETATASVSALQWSVDYAAAAGSVLGAGAAVVCTNQVPGALFAPNDSDAERKLTLGLIALTPFSAPIDLVTCSFLGDAQSPPEASQFVVTVDDASDGEGNTVDVTVGVTVTAVP